MNLNYKIYKTKVVNEYYSDLLKENLENIDQADLKALKLFLKFKMQQIERVENEQFRTH